MDLLPHSLSIDNALQSGDGLGEILAAQAVGPVPAGASVLAPIGKQEVWAAGVTYLRSRNARMDEAEAPDSYDRVYEAARPELFAKAAPGRSVGPHDRIGIRSDSGWDVPEPELALVVDCMGTIVAYTIGNDVSSRRIEGENPLYLPQAKVYRNSCALGPCLVPVDEAPPLDTLRIMLQIERAGTVIYTDEVAVSQMRRHVEELVAWLYLAQDFPLGVVLLTGTAIVPSDGFTLAVDDVVRIAISGLGELVNQVEKVGAPAPTG